MGKAKLREAAKERWRKRKLASLEASEQNKADGQKHSYVSSESKPSELSQADGQKHSSVSTESKPSELSQADGQKHSSVSTESKPSELSQTAALPSKRNKSKANITVVRRSGKLTSLVSFSKSQGKEAVHIDLTNCTDRDVELQIKPAGPKLVNDVTHSEMKLDNLIQTVDGPNPSSLTTDSEPSKHTQSAALSSKRETSKSNNIAVKRSGRLKNLGSSGKSQRRDAVQHVNLTDCDRGTALHNEPVSPKSIRDVTHSKMKSGYLVQNRGKRPFASETTMTDLDYNILCTDSEKKIKVLVEDNYRQAQELQYLRGKVKIYEDMIGVVKDMFAFSKTERPSGAVMNLPCGTVKLHRDVTGVLNSAGAPKPSPVKRKYSVKRMKKNK